MAQPNTDVSPAWVHEVSGMFRTECSRKKGWKMHTAWFPGVFATKGLDPTKERSVKSTFCHAVFSLIDDLGQDWMVHRFEPSKMMQCCWRADVKRKDGTCLRNKRSGCVLQITVWGQGVRSGEDFEGGMLLALDFVVWIIWTRILVAFQDLSRLLKSEHLLSKGRAIIFLGTWDEYLRCKGRVDSTAINRPFGQLQNTKCTPSLRQG